MTNVVTEAIDAMITKPPLPLSRNSQASEYQTRARSTEELIIARDPRSIHKAVVSQTASCYTFNRDSYHVCHQYAISPSEEFATYCPHGANTPVVISMQNILYREVAISWK
jgi:hypothetical protein